MNAARQLLRGLSAPDIATRKGRRLEGTLALQIGLAVMIVILIHAG
jgi:hypothetical protein